MSIQFKDLPDDVQQLIFATAIVDAPRTGVALSAVDKKTRELVQQGCVWQPLANALGVDISQFNPSVHTREIVETHDFQPVADVLQELKQNVKNLMKEEVPRTRTEAQEWLRKMSPDDRDMLLCGVCSYEKCSASQILEICKMLLQEHGIIYKPALDRLMRNSHLSLDTAICTEIVLLLLQHHFCRSWPILFSHGGRIHTPDDEGDGTWETILKDQRKTDIIFYTACDFLLESPELFDPTMTGLFQRGLVPSNFALNEISKRGGTRGEGYRKRMLEIQKQTKPSIGKKLLAIAQSIRNFFTKK